MSRSRKRASADKSAKAIRTRPKGCIETYFASQYWSRAPPREIKLPLRATPRLPWQHSTPAILPFSGSASLFVLDFPCWQLRHNLEDEEDNEIGLRAWAYRARRGVPREQLGRLSGGQGNSIVSRLRGSFQVAAQLAGTTAAGASNPGRPGDAGDSRSGRWKCRNEQCARKTFAETLAIALPFARTRARRRAKHQRRHRSRDPQRLSLSGKPRPLIRRQAGKSRRWLPPPSA